MAHGLTLLGWQPGKFGLDSLPIDQLAGACDDHQFTSLQAFGNGHRLLAEFPTLTGRGLALPSLTTQTSGPLP
ncbi:MAG: hypothetical protein IPL05_04845 [Betaproteobacteria bacterium]|nr:hypothetical protein [Betaproteobacteria bacterium]